MFINSKGGLVRANNLHFFALLFMCSGKVKIHGVAFVRPCEVFRQMAGDPATLPILSVYSDPFSCSLNIVHINSLASLKITSRSCSSTLTSPTRSSPLRRILSTTFPLSTLSPRTPLRQPAPPYHEYQPDPLPLPKTITAAQTGRVTGIPNNCARPLTGGVPAVLYSATSH